MDIEVSFFTFDRLETLGDRKSKKKKGNSKRKFDGESNVEKTKSFWRFLDHRQPLEFHAGHLNVFREERKEAWQRIFLYRRIVVIASATVEQISAPLDTTDCGAQLNDLFFASCVARIEARFPWKYDTEFLFSTILDRESFSWDVGWLLNSIKLFNFFSIHAWNFYNRILFSLLFFFVVWNYIFSYIYIYI